MFGQNKDLQAMKGFTKKRLNDLFVLVIICFFILFVNLWYLQVIRGYEYRQRAMNNCIRSLVEEAARGEVYDQQGKLLVTNRPAVNLSVIPAEINSYQSFSEVLGSIIPADIYSIQGNLEKSNQNSFKAQTIKRDLDKNQIIAIEEQRYKLKGSLLNIQPERKYLYQDLAAHILGYVNEISLEELSNDYFSHLSGGDIIGKAGIERTYDAFLRGIKGNKEVEVDALGREITTLQFKEPIPGNDVHLTIHSDLQKYIQDLMTDKKGAVIVSEPSTGKVLSMVSQPTYNPNIFTQQISETDWQEIVLSEDNILCNRSIQGVYPPGSVFKLITAIAALEEGIVQLDDHVYCPGSFRLGEMVFRCWRETGHGQQTIREAIANSCNVFFYTMGQKLGIDTLNRYARMFGLGEKTGVDLPGELSGLVPSQDWKRRTFNVAWYPGDTINMSIGQGYLLVTPLQIHNMACIIANEGSFFKPFHVEKITDPSGQLIQENKPVLVSQTGISRETFRIVKEGMRNVILKGTGWKANIDEIPLAGKTGTAQNPQGENHGWFVGFAPVENPEICVTVFVEHGGDGSEAAAPLAGQIIQEYFQIKRVNQSIVKEQSNYP